jgi:hypothetical protein
MSHNDAVDFAQRLYARVPANYRAYDADQGLPLYALLTVVGEQAANIRADLDSLWDNFFIETCQDWVVPYLGALAGTNLLLKPVGESSRLDVWNTVQWRRSKGTPQMLQSLAQAISGWPASMSEFFLALGWSQNMNHVRVDQPLTPNLRRPGLSAHAADFHPAPELAEPRGAWDSPGRYNVKNAGFFVSRLQMFPVSGVTPAASAPGTSAAAGNSCFSFNPLFRDVPLFSSDTGKAIRRSDLAASPWSYFGNDADIAVRQAGILLAADAAPSAVPAAAGFQPFTFGGAGAGLGLDGSHGPALLPPERFQLGATNFVVSAQWKNGATVTTLGQFTTRNPVLAPGAKAPGTGQLALHVAADSASPSVWFPGAVVVVRAANTGLLRSTDSLYVYLPPAKTPASFDVSQDGSTFVNGKLARASEGQVYPPRLLSQSTRPADGFLQLHQKAGLVLADPARYNGEIKLAAGTDHSLLSITMTPNAGVTSIPPAELIVTNRAGQALLVYLPEDATSHAVSVFVADDGSTYFVPTDPAVLIAAQNQHSFSGLVLARASAGQSLPLPGLWPLRQRRPVAMNLCSPLRSALLAPGQLGIDPELGRFALPPGDPAVAAGKFSVDYVEACSAPIGALNYDRQLDPNTHANVVVAQSGDADTPVAVHTTLADAVSAARDGDIIEIADSASYLSASIAASNSAVKNLTIRAAAGQRPCLLFYDNTGALEASSLSFTVPMTSLSFNGLLLSGGPILIEGLVKQVTLTSCSLDPEPGVAMLEASDTTLTSGAVYVLSACVVGGIGTAIGVTQLTIADSIVDAKAKAAITASGKVQLERCTVVGTITAGVLTASECLLNDLASVQDQQAGCVRFSRFEAGYVLPRRYRSIPNDQQLQACSKSARCLAPFFHSRRFPRPDYMQLAAGCASPILSASESGAEVGAFASGLNTIRLGNLRTKLQEFMPVGLTAIVIADT